MTTVQLSMTFVVTGATDLDAHTDAVMNELIDLENADVELSDSDMSAVLADNWVRLGIMCRGDSFESASAKASATIRAAIHAARGATPDWATDDVEVMEPSYGLREQQLVLAS